MDHNKIIIIQEMIRKEVEKLETIDPHLANRLYKLLILLNREFTKGLEEEMELHGTK